MTDPILYGPGYSTYVRSARLALAEKGVHYQFEEFDFFQSMPSEQLERHPFGKVPAFRHNDFQLYETSAITRYVDEAFPGPSLQPETPRQRARMTQIISLLDGYGYGPIISDTVIQRIVMPMMGQDSNEETIRNALPKAEKCIQVLEGFLDEHTYLASDSLSLADLHFIPIYDYFSNTPDGDPILERAPKLAQWWRAVSALESVTYTKPNLG
jgi:glutathione S-transferase